MRIALVHSYYRSAQPSGENTMVDQQVAALRKAGHEATVVAHRSDDERGGPVSAVRAAWNVGTGAGSDPTAELAELDPDIVHVHNLFPNFSTRWLPRWTGPLVATLHNYRSVCANAMLLRDGRTCTDCPDGDRWAGVRHRCYRDSAAASLPLAFRNRRGLAADPLVARADSVIVLSDRARTLFTTYGAPADRLVLLPNGIPEPPAGTAPEAGDAWVAVGRLTPEKGWDWLMRNWPPEHRLDVIGSGPLETAMRRSSPSSVRFLGGMTNSEVRDLLPQYNGAVFAGVNVEGAYPLTAVEALAAGLPLIARTGGAAAEMVARWDCGRTFTGTNALREALADRPADTLRRHCRAVFRQTFAEAGWVSGLLDVYGAAMRRRRA